MPPPPSRVSVPVPAVERVVAVRRPGCSTGATVQRVVAVVAGEEIGAAVAGNEVGERIASARQCRTADERQILDISQDRRLVALRSNETELRTRSLPCPAGPRSRDRWRCRPHRCDHRLRRDMVFVARQAVEDLCVVVADQTVGEESPVPSMASPPINCMNSTFHPRTKLMLARTTSPRRRPLRR